MPGVIRVTLNYRKKKKMLSFTRVYCKYALLLGHLKIINFPFAPNGKFIIFRCPKIWAHYSPVIMSLNIRTPNNYYSPFGTNGKVVVLGGPIRKHFRVNEKRLPM